MSQRRFMTFSIDALEKLFDESRDKRDTLESIGAELLNRETRRAKKLVERVNQAIAVLPPDEASNEQSIWDALCARLSPEENEFIQRVPSLKLPVFFGKDETPRAGVEFARFELHASIPRLRGMLSKDTSLHANFDVHGEILRLSVFELRNGPVSGWPGFAILIHKLFGEHIIPWLPSLFLAAAAMPDIKFTDFNLEEVMEFPHQV